MSCEVEELLEKFSVINSYCPTLRLNQFNDVFRSVSLFFATDENPVQVKEGFTLSFFIVVREDGRIASLLPSNYRGIFNICFLKKDLVSYYFSKQNPQRKDFLAAVLQLELLSSQA